MAEKSGALAGKVALVTGGGRGIGAAVALAFAREGADLVLASRTDSELVETATAARRLGATVHAVSADVAEVADVDRLVRSALQTFGRPDGLVKNRGGAHRAGPHRE